MIIISRLMLFGWFLFVIPLCSALEQPTEGKLKSLYSSIDPLSVSKHLAYYELYANHPLGQQALRDAWALLAGPSLSVDFSAKGVVLSEKVINALAGLVNKPIDQELTLLDEESLKTFQTLSTRLSHVNLKGHHVWTEQEVLDLPLEEIDLARGLFISQFGAGQQQRILSYEALIDLMALQILVRLPKNASPEDKIACINTFVFDEMGFRFPPHSLFTKEIDLYSFLPSVLDSHRGVCLGVSILYICLAQRLSLPLEMITPPGHIFVRYRQGDQIINIETTARGIHMESERYLGVNIRSLPQRTIREVIGMAHFNQASCYWQQDDYATAIQSYRKAEPYMRGDPLLKELMGYVLLLHGEKEKGEKLLWEVKDHVPDYALVKSPVTEDYFKQQVDAQGIRAIYSKTEEDRQSILNHKGEIEKVLEQYPKFRSGILCLASIWMQLHRAGEALAVLETYLTLDKRDPEVHYYLSILSAQRRDYLKAWHHLQEAERITRSFGYEPKDLKELRRELLSCCPE